MAQKPPGPDQHHGHDDELHRERELRIPQTDAEGLDLADEERREEGTGHRAQAADHDDDERIGYHRQIDLQVRRLSRYHERAAESCQRRAEHEDRGEQALLVYAERRGHFESCLRRVPACPARRVAKMQARTPRDRAR